MPNPTPTSLQGVRMGGDQIDPGVDAFRTDLQPWPTIDMVGDVIMPRIQAEKKFLCPWSCTHRKSSLYSLSWGLELLLLLEVGGLSGPEPSYGCRDWFRLTLAASCLLLTGMTGLLSYIFRASRESTVFALVSLIEADTSTHLSQSSRFTANEDLTKDSLVTSINAASLSIIFLARWFLCNDN